MSTEIDYLSMDLNKIVLAYQQLFLSRLQHILPIKINKPILPDDLTSKFYYVEVAEVLYNLNINNTVLIKRQDIVKLYNLLITEISNKVTQRLKVTNKLQLLFVYYSLAAYFAEFHGRITQLLKKEMRIEDFNNIMDSEIKILEVVKENSNFLPEIDSLKALDKATIQYLINMIVYSESSDTYTAEIKDIFEFFFLAGALIRLISERELVTSNTINEIAIEIRNYSILFNDDYMKIMKNYSTNLLEESSEDFIVEDTIAILENNFAKVNGFNLLTVENMLENTGRSFKDKFVCNLIDRPSLLSIISQDGECSYKEAENLLNYMIISRPSSSEFIYKSFDKHEKRIFEFPFLQVNIFTDVEAFLFSYPLLLHSYMLLRKKLLYNLIPECQKYNSRIIDKKIKNKFVKEVEKILKPYTKLILTNVQKLENQEITIYLEREIDLLAVTEESLLLFECKDVYYSFSAAACRQDLSDCIRFINNIMLKVEEIEQKQTKIKKYLQFDFNSIHPVLVYKNYNVSIDSLIDKKGVIVTSHSKLAEFMEVFCH
ncbi:MAG: hypothetical protein APF84_13245 [Gracilibacter sp. BRH_c7a]|nr:MAG: hypothetical protein APF84_13245 [Gracilibacter sp. BRH_c7a]